MNNVNLPSIDELIEITQVFKEKLLTKYDLTNMEILFHVDNAVLKKINEELYYRNNPQATDNPEETDEIDLNINGIQFKYVLKED